MKKKMKRWKPKSKLEQNTKLQSENYHQVETQNLMHDSVLCNPECYCPFTLCDYDRPAIWVWSKNCNAILDVKNS